jgi:hypothetical protein
MSEGKRLKAPEPLATIRERFREEFATLDDPHKEPGES